MEILIWKPVRELLRLKNTDYVDLVTLDEMFEKFQPRLLSYDIKQIFVKLNPQIKERLFGDNISSGLKIMGSKFTLPKERVIELVEKQNEIVSLLMESPLVFYNFHNFMSRCSSSAMSVILPSHYIIRDTNKKCNLYFLCPICNAYLLLYLYAFLHLQVRERSKGKVYKRKTLLLCYRNFNFNFKFYIRDLIFVFVENFLQRFFPGVDYLFVIRPAFQRQVDKNKESLFDVYLLLLDCLDLQFMSYRTLHQWSFEQLSELGKSVDTTINFDFEAYQVDFFVKDLFDVVSVLLYRLPLELYMEQGIQLSYYHYLMTYFYVHSDIFKTFMFLFNKKKFINELYTEFREKRYYRHFKMEQ